MKKLKINLVIALAIFFSLTLNAEEKAQKSESLKSEKNPTIFKLNFFNRTRFYGKKTDDADWEERFTQKTIFGMQAMKKGIGKAVFQIRNASILGTGYPNGYILSDGLSVYQAYGQTKLPFGEHSCLYFGRKEINLDTQYIFGAVGFSDIGKTFDTAGLKMVFLEKKLKMNLFTVRQFEKDTNIIKNDEFLNTLHLRYDLKKDLGFSFLFINDMMYDKDTDKNYISNLVGLRANGMISGFGFNFETYFQFGDNVIIGAAKADRGSISAYAVLLDLFYKIDNLKAKPKLGFLLNLNSGDDDTTDDTNKNFYVAMGTKHKWFGLMDLFLEPQNWGNQGIIDLSPYANWTCGLLKDLSFKFNYHYFMPMTKVDNNDKKSLGMEFDLSAKLKLNEAFSFSGTFGYFIPGDLQENNIKDKQLMGYASLQVKF